MNACINATSTTFVNFDRFLKLNYDKEVQMYECFSEKPISFEAYKKNYVAMYGIKPWLDTLQGLNATDKQLYSILNTYIKDAKRTINEIPQLLAWLDRYFDITIPLIEGIATSDYWQARLARW